MAEFSMVRRSQLRSTGGRTSGRAGRRGEVRIVVRESRLAGGVSDFDAVADLELGESAQVEQLGHVLLAAEGGEHA
jgi:hypothetical protein